MNVLLLLRVVCLEKKLVLSLKLEIIGFISILNINKRVPIRIGFILVTEHVIRDLLLLSGPGGE